MLTLLEGKKHSDSIFPEICMSSQRVLSRNLLPVIRAVLRIEYNEVLRHNL